MNCWHLTLIGGSADLSNFETYCLPCRYILDRNNLLIYPIWLVDAWFGIGSSAALLINPRSNKGLFNGPSAWNVYYSQPGMTRKTKGVFCKLANSTRLVRPLWHHAHRFQQLRSHCLSHLRSRHDEEIVTTFGRKRTNKTCWMVPQWFRWLCIQQGFVWNGRIGYKKHKFLQPLRQPWIFETVISSAPIANLRNVAINATDRQAPTRPSKLTGSTQSLRLIDSITLISRRS